MSLSLSCQSNSVVGSDLDFLHSPKVIVEFRSDRQDLGGHFCQRSKISDYTARLNPGKAACTSGLAESSELR